MKATLKNILYEIYVKKAGQLETFRNKHDGESCYIIGDGVSLKWFDLRHFNDKPIFSLSYLFFHQDFCQLNTPIYSSIFAPWYFYPYIRLGVPPYTMWRNKVQIRFRQFIKEYKYVNFFINLSNFPCIRAENVHFLFQMIPDFEFSTRCISQRLRPFDGSFATAITLAIYMGFKKIYLVGCDYTHFPSYVGHWYEYGPGRIVAHPDYQKAFLDLAQNYTEICTITRENDSKILPSITYGDYTNSAPKYRENYELVQHDDLLLLDTFPVYRMFENTSKPII